MQQIIGFLIIIAFLALTARWIFVHWRFRSVLRQERPEIARKLSGAGLAYSGGLEWIDFALSRGYRDLGSARLQESGDALVNAYGKFQLAWLIGAVILAVSFIVSLFISAG